MRKKVLITVLVITVITLTVSLRIKDTRFMRLTNKLEQKIRDDSITKNELLCRIQLLFKLDNQRIDSNTKLFYENGDSILLKEIKFDRYLFVVRFSEFHCLNCITSEMKLVAQKAKLNKNTIFLATYNYLSDLKVNKRIMGLSCPVYNIPLGTIDNIIEKNKLPYYFVIDSNYRIKHLFIADPNNPMLTNKYLEFIESIFSAP